MCGPKTGSEKECWADIVLNSFSSWWIVTARNMEEGFVAGTDEIIEKQWR